MGVLILNKVGRNDLCPCGSGKKYKKCCMMKDEAKNLENSSNDTVPEYLLHEQKNPSQLRGRAAEIYNIFRRGCNLLDRNEYDLAVKSFTSVLRLDPYHYEALTGLGRCLLEIGNREEAFKCFEQALKIRPDYAQARLNLDLMR
jgi:tetratricopeptide (TPR) repeat protein